MRTIQNDRFPYALILKFSHIECVNVFLHDFTSGYSHKHLGSKYPKYAY